MKVAKNIILFAVLFVAFTVSALLLWPGSGNAREHGSAAATSRSSGTEVQQEQGGNSPSTKAISALQATQVVAPGVIYAPRDVVDMTRLVLEASRDQNSHLAHYIERATTIIVVFFTLLGAVGAAFGLHKINDVEKKAKEAIDKFENDLKASREKATTLETEFQQKIFEATNALHREIDDQVDLTAAREEIDQAINGKFETTSMNRMLTNAAARIQVVLEKKTVSDKARIRGLAHLAFAKKRLGSFEAATDYILDAAALAEKSYPEMLPLLAFNAACYSALDTRQKSDPCIWLAKAIQLNPQYKESAADDPDFNGIKETERFRALLK